MKRIRLAALMVILSFLMVPSVYALPLDLSGFTAEPGVDLVVVGTNTTVNFTESQALDQDGNLLSAFYFYNDSFLVPDKATYLSFNYDFLLGEYDPGDHLTFELNNAIPPNLDVLAEITGGGFSIDLSGFRTQTISLAWGVVWGGDMDDVAGTTASIYDIDLGIDTTTNNNPVPEPGTVILLGIGLLGLTGYGRKKYTPKS